MMDTGGLPLADLNPLDLNQQDSEGKTRLHRATINGSVDEIKELLHSGAAVHLKDFLGNEPLQYAVGALNSEATDLLLRFGANANTKGSMSYSPLHFAVQQGAILDKLLFHGAAPCAQDDEGNTPLHIAISTPSAYSEHPKSVIDSLLSSGSDVNLANKAGITPFHKLLGQPYSGNASILKFLWLFLDSGADVLSCLPGNRTPLEVFLTSCDSEWNERYTRAHSVFGKFIDKGANLDIKLPSKERLVFEYLGRSCYRIDWNIAQLLCSRVDLGSLNCEGNSILHELCNLQQEPTLYKDISGLISTVLERGANVNHRNSLGQTPLLSFLLGVHDRYRKRWLGLTKAVGNLLEHGADLLAHDLSGNCPLYEAARHWPDKFLADMVSAISEDDDGCHQASSPGVFWTNFYRAFRTEDWVEAKNQLWSCDGLLPKDVDGKIRQCASKLLASKFLKLAEDVFDGQIDWVQKRRNFMAMILRDCRKRKVKVDMEYMDLLLELCR